MMMMIIIDGIGPCSILEHLHAYIETAAKLSRPGFLSSWFIIYACCVCLLVSRVCAPDVSYYDDAMYVSHFVDENVLVAYT
jgi:hypothetical protein